MLKIGINGFGRIGRMISRAYFENLRDYEDIQIVCINDIADKSTNIYMLKYDSVHGRAQFEISETHSGFRVGSHDLKMVIEPDPEKIDWKSQGVDVVLECSGRFTKKTDAERHIKGGADRVIVSAPSSDADITVVYGINHKDIGDSHRVISNGSCTTNCIAPVVYLLDKAYGIDVGYMTTVHAYTGDQRLVDTAHKDLRRARAACLSMIPTSTGAAKAVGLILPHLKGKLDGCSIRVPTSNVSLVDFKCTLKNPATEEKINELMRDNSLGEMKGVLGYNDEPLVSVDFNHLRYSSVFDATGTKVLNDGRFCRIMTWYDNEFGFSNRMLDLCQYIATNG
jgi:glyceraldehyde 3-phosphate dehydrogenase